MSTEPVPTRPSARAPATGLPCRNAAADSRRPVMRVLIDIVHPADVNFFAYAADRLRTLGHRVLIASRDKDVTLALLAARGLEHRCLSRARDGLAGLAGELVQRDLALLRMVRAERPTVLCGFGGVSIAHVGRLLGIPAISFYDTERAPLQHLLTLRWLHRLYVPDCYDGPVATGRTTRFPGVKELAYLHPSRFRPDEAVARAAGLASGRNLFVRRVSWGSNHDVGRGGWPLPVLREVLARWQGRWHVHLSAEGPLPPDLEPFRYRGSPEQVHHLLAHCDAYVGESATMAAEAAVLGVPSLYAADDRRCYTDALQRAGLLRALRETTADAIVAELDELLAVPRAAWSARHNAYLNDKPDLGEYVVGAISDHGARPGGAVR